MKTCTLLATFLFVGCNDNYISRDCYLDCGHPDRNMAQSGVDDVQIDMVTRQKYAFEHNLPPPR